MDLYLLRHAIAEERSGSQPGGDSQRRLTNHGARKMHRVAKGMKALELEFDLILSSPYLRAKETAEIVAKVFDQDKVLQLAPALTPDGNPRDLIEDLIRDHPRRKHILVVGHEPYLSSLISLLLSGKTDMSITLKKGGLCRLTVEKLHYGRCATLEWLLTPGQMRSLK
jgi:phosphohistidine phosphatase